MMIRTFIALEIPEEVKQKIISIAGINYLDKSVRWESVDKLHITLKFLGDTDENKVREIIEKVSKIVSNKGVIDLFFSRFGFFKRDGQPKIFWVGFEENQNLVNLVREIDEMCAGFGFPRDERKFKPHLTLLRIRGNEKLEHLYSLSKLELEKKKYISDTITFYKSILKPSGSEYSVLKKFYLKKILL